MSVTLYFCMTWTVLALADIANVGHSSIASAKLTVSQSMVPDILAEPVLLCRLDKHLYCVDCRTAVLIL